MDESGIDFQGNYRLDLDDVGAKGMGSLAFDFNGALLLTEVTALPGVASYDCTGLYGSKCQVVSPAWRHTFRVTWNTPWQLSASLQWRYIGPVTLDYLSSNPLLNNPALFLGDQIEGRLHAYNYFDLVFTYKVRDNLTLRAGCNNLFDIDPPVVDANNIGISGPPYGNANTFPGVYDSLGRNIFVGLTANF